MKTILQPLRGFKYDVVVNTMMGTYQIIENDTDKASDVMDDMDYYSKLKKAYRQSKKALDDMCEGEI